MTTSTIKTETWDSITAYSFNVYAASGAHINTVTAYVDEDFEEAFVRIEETIENYISKEKHFSDPFEANMYALKVLKKMKDKIN